MGLLSCLPRRNLTALARSFVLALVIFFIFYGFDQVLQKKKQDEANYAERIKEAKEAQGKEDDNPNPIGNVIADEKYKIDGAVKNGAEKVKIDWHDWDQIGSDLRRTEGAGEQGHPVHISDAEKNTDEFREAHRSNGFAGYVSDKISLDRAIPDIRHPQCKNKKYLADLPPASIIIPFYNEHWSTLLRSVHSIFKRSPLELVKEIILVDDASQKEHLKQKLEDYISEKNSKEWENKVRVERLKERDGLIGARLAGAKAATAEILIFLDCHIEVNVNWLPPLLEPIAEDPKTSVCPFIDVIAHDTFEYRAQDEGARGSFDWQLDYKRLPLLPEDLQNPTRPFKSPVMAGGLFAISTKFFWELGGYDPGLHIWGGEQYELSFKIWQCGGQLLDAPCSRVGHVYRQFAPFSFGGALGKNHKRVMDVWMDEYKEYVYIRRPHYRNLDPGDISKQKQLRTDLQCKSFKWFMEEIAFDQDAHYPAIVPPDFASGYIKSDADPELCVDSKLHSKITISSCSKSSGGRQDQTFSFTYKKDIHLGTDPGSKTCWDVQSGDGSPILTYACHGQGGNQLWKYNAHDKTIVQPNRHLCLDCDPKEKQLMVRTCDTNSKTQKWTIENVNLERMEKWDEDRFDFKSRKSKIK